MTIHNTLHNSILEKIQSGVVKQKPKWHFILLTLFFVFGLIALSCILLYLVSFVALILREHFIVEAISFGPGTVFAILHTLPFLLLVIVSTVFLLLHVLVRHFAFAYMKPVIATLSGGILLVALMFTTVLFMDTNSRIARLGEGRHVPGIQTLHSSFRDRVPPRPIRGTVLQVGTSTLTIEDASTTVTIAVSPFTRKDKTLYSAGDSVVVLTKKSGEKLEAIAIREFSEGERFQKPVSRPNR